MTGQTWFAEVFPNDLGDDNHRWSWLVKATSNEPEDDGKDLLWLHRCKGGKWSVSWIDLTSGNYHHLVADDPLHVEPSVLCPAGCGDHGFIREGRWVGA
jgi:hypothetical protein